MYWIVIFYVVCWSASALESSNSLDLSWKTKISYENKTRTTKSCILPAHPENGGYMVPGHPDAKPGDVFEDISYIQYKNVEGDQLVEIKNFKCSSGRWSLKIFKYESEKMYFNTSWCDLFQSSPFNKRLSVRLSDCSKVNPSAAQKFAPRTGLCELPSYPSLGKYTVMNRPDADPGDVLDSVHLVYECNPRATMVGERAIFCVNNVWSAEPPTCLKCGKAIDYHRGFLAGAIDAQLTSVPWQVGVYDKSFAPYKQICGGSIIALNIVISAAHCFWTDVDKLRSALRFAVAGSKIYRPWDDLLDVSAQKSDVSEIKIPPRYRGSQTNFQDDIALLFLATPFTHTEYLMPVCLDFDAKFDALQIGEGKLGRTAGWGLVGEDGTGASKLQTALLPSVGISRCIDDAASNFRAYITSDKICAGYTNGTALCKGDSGGGLAFIDDRIDKPDEQYHYLRGVVSTAPTNDQACNVYAITSFTHVFAHQYFIKENWNKAIL